MKQRKFKGEVISGHKEDAVEVPFDPGSVWNLGSQPLWRGRRGHVVEGKLNGREFTSIVIPRQKKFFMVIDASIEQSAGITAGDLVEISLKPSAHRQS